MWLHLKSGTCKLLCSLSPPPPSDTRCEHREPRRKVHHHLCGLLLPLLLQDEGSYCGGQEGWQGNKYTRVQTVRESWRIRKFLFLSFCFPHFLFLMFFLPLRICSQPSSICLTQVLDNCIEAENIVNRYEALASDLLDWIEKTIAVISNQKFANSLTGVQQQLQAFTTYCTIEKPIKCV